MYAEGSGEVADSPLQTKAAFVQEDDTERGKEASAVDRDPQGEVGVTVVAVAEDSSEEALRRLRSAFVELKAEVDAIVESSTNPIPIRHRGISLRILKDRIDSVVGEGEVSALKCLVLKVQQALEAERLRSFQLEQQLHQMDQHEDTIETTKSKLIHFEQQASEWKSRHDNLQHEVTSLKSQTEQQSLQQQSLQRSLAEAQTEYHELHQLHQQLKEEALQKTVQLERALEGERQAKAAALDRIEHLEKLILKMEEDAVVSPLLESSDTMAPPAAINVADRTSPKQQSTSLPDPPSDDDTLKGEDNTMPEAEVKEESSTAVAHRVSEENPNNPIRARTHEHDMKADAKAVEEQQSRDVVTPNEGRWKWNVSGIWGYVTGEPIHE